MLMIMFTIADDVTSVPSTLTILSPSSFPLIVRVSLQSVLLLQESLSSTLYSDADPDIAAFCFSRKDCICSLLKYTV
jgi:hypothetical protein